MTLEVKPANRRRVDRYELLELIGEGGMGAVYRALDTRLGRTVALKTVLTTPRGTEAFNKELRQRFMREALAASKVEHRNVVQVIDFGVAEDGTPYLVMEYLRGCDLAALLKDSPGLLPIEQVADIMLNVCAALRACHQAGIVHRDLKPSNIFLAETDTGPAVKVLDFGVSKAAIAGDLTQEGQILGTPQYLSPEQVNGRVGPESDQYALGVLLYVCLTNRLPFEEHQNLSLLRAIEAGRFASPRIHRPELPEALEGIVLRAMHVDPAQRFESVHALGQALWPFASTRGQIEWKNYYFHATPAVGAH
jgi:eukaryotic-like serine/threonine-protein kinase